MDQRGHFWFSGSHMIRHHCRLGQCHVTHPSMPVRQESIDQPALPFPRVSGIPVTIPVLCLSRDTLQVRKGLFPTAHVKCHAICSVPR